MSDIIIQAENISKVYRLGTIGTGSLRQDMQSWWNKKVIKKDDPFFVNDRISKQHIWALKNVSFDIRQGEVWGIVGSNGAGKSTLLKILSRIIKPTEGIVRGKGKISSLLEIGTGFHYELTGRENIFLSGHMLGMNKPEILRRFDEIVAFSEIEQFLDTPVKRYSSGMYVRLAFAVAAHLEPDILIVDEVLAVGDTAFQKKCLNRIKDISRNMGKTVLFVSHNVITVEQLCSHALYLQNGVVADTGKATSVVNTYLNDVNAHMLLTERELAPGVSLEKLDLGSNSIDSGDDLEFKIKVKFDQKPKIRELAVLIYNSKSMRIAMIDLRPYFDFITYTDTHFCYKGVIRKINLVEGEYYIGFFYFINDTYKDIYDLKRITIREKTTTSKLKKYDTPYRGLVELTHENL